MLMIKRAYIIEDLIPNRLGGCHGPSFFFVLASSGQCRATARFSKYGDSSSSTNERCLAGPCQPTNNRNEASTMTSTIGAPRNINKQTDKQTCCRGTAAAAGAAAGAGRGWNRYPHAQLHDLTATGAGVVFLSCHRAGGGR